ncbi:MAG: hypothetical protein JXD23_09980 [Spirochaetales bacterium]|nr:hypothetical protein [Spirochaetales bacterium]
MKKTIVLGKTIFLACLFAAACVNAPPQASPPPAGDIPAEFAKAEQSFEKGTFQAAYDSYALVYKGTNDAELKLKSFFRMCESLTHLFRYGEAAQLLLDTPPPQAPRDRARVLLLKAGLLRSFLDQYGYLLGRNESEESDESENAFHFTQEQVESEIKTCWESLASLKDTLKSMSLKDEGYFFLTEGIDFGMFPTLYDFYVQRRTDGLVSGQDVSETEIRFLLGEILPKYKAFPQVIRAANIMSEAASFMADAYPESSEYWRVKRLGLLLDVGWDVPAAAQANALREKIVAALRDVMAKLTLPGPKALAGVKAAGLLNVPGKYVEARKLCETVLKDFPETHAVKNAKALRQQIINPSLSLSTATMTVKDQKKLTLSVRNLSKVYFRAYKIKGDALARLEKDPSDLYTLSSSSVEGEIPKLIMTGAPDFSWETETGDPGKHEYLSLTIAPPALGGGMYYVLACNDPSFVSGQTLLCSSLVNVTSLVLVAAPGPTLKSRTAYYNTVAGRGGKEITDSLARYYAFDAATGAQVTGARVLVSWNRDYGAWRRAETKTGPLGAGLELPTSNVPGGHGQIGLAPLAEKGGSYAYLENAQSLWRYQPDAIEFFIETDRPIYRPGDKLMAKITGVRRTSDGFRALDKGFTVRVKAADPNGNAIMGKDLTVNDFGSADCEFDIPRGKLLGAYSLRATAARGVLSGSGGASFRVEEYKRPEFEITFDPIEKPLRFGRPAELSGSVKYYFGGAAAGAAVEFRVTHSLYVPWYYRSWFWWGYRPESKETASGTIITDDEGKFRIVFTPKAEDVDLPDWMKNGLTPEIADYSVTVTARDSGGRTIEGATSARVGKAGYYFTAEPDKGFYFEKDRAVFNAAKLSVNDRPLAGKAGYVVHLISNPQLKSLTELGYSGGRSGSIGPGAPGPEFQLKDAENLEVTARGTMTFGTEGRSRLTLVDLTPGAYRLTLTGKDDEGADVVLNKIFVVANSSGRDVPLNLASVTLFEKNEYRPGETAKVLIGSRFTSGAYMMEIWAGGYFVKNVAVAAGKPVQAVSVPVTADMKGGFTVRWFGAKGLDIHYGQASAAVPWSDKNLSLALEPFKDKLLPGEKTTWGVRAKNPAGKPVQSEVLVLMYDRSLEYYATADRSGFGSLYPPNRQPDAGGGSDFIPRTYSASLRDGELYRQLYIETRFEEEKQPGFRTDMTGGYGYRGGLYYYKEGAEMFDMMMPAPMVAEAGIDQTKKDGPTIGLTRNEKSPQGPPMPAVETRKAFADTAYFLPHVTTDRSGSATFSFTAPEQLTGWKIKAFALTKDASWGEIEKEAVTRKDLMVRLDLPRFFREKDKGTITAVVHNESDGALSGTLWIDVLDGKTSVQAALKLNEASREFKVKAHGLQTFDWPVEIPAGIATYTVKAVVKTEAVGKTRALSDAEERTLPVLPSRERLIESAFAVLRGDETKTISIPAADDPTRINESVTLRIDPQLTLSLMNTLPFLVDYPYSCVEQTLNKYVPLAVVNEIYGKYPEVRTAVAKIPKRDTVTPPWEVKDPLRQLTIDETPWGWEAKGRPTIYPVIDLLDPAIVSAQKESVFASLKSSQLSSGAFPWWPGGREDLYMTLYALSSLAEAKRYGVALDKDMVNKALAYVNAAVPKEFKPEPYQLSIIAFASYAVTSFPAKEFPEAATSAELVKGWLGFLYEHRFALTPFGKGYLAHVYFRLGDKDKAEEILAMALDGAREDPVAGVYWTPEAYSWVWYSDTVEKHAFFLKTLLEWKPDDKRIDGMARWLLWNRKGNVWKSTKASAAALYALLEYMARGGSLFSDERFTVDWGTSRETVQANASDWSKEPLRISRPDAPIGAAGLSASVKKEGRGTSFAGLTWVYSTDQLPQASGPGLIELKRRFFIREKSGTEYKLREIKSGGEAAVGDEIEVKVTVTTKSQFEYMHLKDPKASGFEAEALLSGWKYDPLWYYEEPRDSSTNFFLDRLPHGEYVLRYRLRPTKPGEYRVGAATLQSMYAPDLNAHSTGFVIRVRKSK